jgi:hypothetical protein
MSEIDLEPVRGHVEVLRWCKQQRAIIKATEDNARAAVEAHMGNRQIGLLDGEPAIQWPSYKENRFDSAIFRAEHPEMWEQYKAMNEKRRFDVL